MPAKRGRVRGAPGCGRRTKGFSGCGRITSRRGVGVNGSFPHYGRGRERRNVVPPLYRCSHSLGVRAAAVVSRLARDRWGFRRAGWPCPAAELNGFVQARVATGSQRQWRSSVNLEQCGSAFRGAATGPTRTITTLACQAGQLDRQRAVAAPASASPGNARLSSRCFDKIAGERRGNLD